jgi:hypothetical protein
VSQPPSLGHLPPSLAFVHKLSQFLLLATKNLFFFMEPEFELRTLCLQSRHSTAWATPPVHFGMVILEIGPRKLLACTGLQFRPSRSQPPSS